MRDSSSVSRTIREMTACVTERFIRAILLNVE
jgi:hypothetical protein